MSFWKNFYTEMSKKLLEFKYLSNANLSIYFRDFFPLISFWSTFFCHKLWLKAVEVNRNYTLYSEVEKWALLPVASFP